VLLLLALVITMEWVDYLTGVEFSVSLLYLIPITLGTWVAGRSMGNVVALASVGAWLGADLLAGHCYGHWLFPAWNSLTLAVSFLVVVALLASLCEANEGLEQTVARRTRALQAENTQRRQAEEEGLDRIFTDAGFEWRLPGCSMCFGGRFDSLARGERCASTSNRNFENRQGRGGRTHLVGPAMAAAAAVRGTLADLRDFL